MVALRTGLAASLVTLLVALTALALTVGLSVTAWAVGLASAALTCAAVAGLHSSTAADRLGPADLLTMGRVSLTCAVAALVAESFGQQPEVLALVVLATAAMLLDAADGQVARRTATQSPFGARFDGEADAFLILVLSVFTARWVAGWVLLIGAARYAFAAAGCLLPWLRRELPFRYWRKVVTAVQGIVLTVAAAGVAPWIVSLTALGLALGLLVESFGRDVLWLWIHRSGATAATARRGRRVGVSAS